MNADPVPRADATAQRRLPRAGRFVWLAGAYLTATGCAASDRARAVVPDCSACWTYNQRGIVRGDPSAKKIALVFTGGEHGEGTQDILNTLHGVGVKASFFVTGDYLAEPEYRPLVRRMVAEGHYLGPHSDSHTLYCAWDNRKRSLVTERFFRHDLQKNIADLRRFGALRSGDPIFFIPPYEWYNAEQVLWAKRMDVVLCNLTPGSGSNRDWAPEGNPGFVSSEVILRDVLAFERKEPDGLNGFLLLLHLGSQRRDKMHAHLQVLVDELVRRGYRFVRIDEMLRR